MKARTRAQDRWLEAAFRVHPGELRPTLLRAFLALSFLLATPARAYDEWVHQLIGERALPGDLPRALAPASRAGVEALRAATWAAGASHSDPSVRARFRARYPRAAAFDDWAWKDLLGLTPEARVSGIDTLPAPQPDARAIAAAAARAPDDDRRNQERFATTPHGGSCATPGEGRFPPTRRSSTWARSPASPARPGPTTACPSCSSRTTRRC